MGLGNFLKGVVAVAAVVGVVAATGGLGAIAGSGLFLTAGGSLTFGAKLGVALLLSVASSRLMPKPSMPNYDSSFRGRMLSIRQPVVPRELVYGHVRKGGTIIFADTSKTTTTKTRTVRKGTSISTFEYDLVEETVTSDTFRRLDIIIVFATHQCLKIGNIYFNGEVAIADGSTGATNGRFQDDNGNPLVYVERHLGDPSTIQPFPELSNERGSGIWSDAHNLKGVTAIALKLFYEADAYPSGIPNITVDLWGKNDIYDPSIDDYQYTSNAALCLADYLTNDTFGVGMTLGAEDGLDTQTVLDSNTVCNEPVTKPDGSTEPRYQCNGVVDLSQDKKTNIEAMLSAMSGDLIYEGGQFKLYAGYYRPPTQTITSDDITLGGLSMSTRVTRSENFNGVRGQFVSPENDWQPDDFPSYQSSVYLAEDSGQEAWDDINLPFTTSPYAAQRLAKIHLEKVRRQISVSLTCKLQGWRANAGDVVNLDYPRWGFNNKPFLIKGQSIRVEEGSFVVDMELQETSPLVYDSNASEFEIYQAAPRTNLPSAFIVGTPIGLSFEEELYVNRRGTAAKNRLVISWVEDSSLATEKYQVERQFPGASWERLGEASDTRFIIDDAESGPFNWRVRAVSVLGVHSEWNTASYTVNGLTEPPLSVSGLRIQQAGGVAVISWLEHPDIDVIFGGEILIRHSDVSSPNWSNGVFMDRVPGSSTTANLPLLPGVYLLRAVDSSGNLGPVSTISTDGTTVVSFVTAAPTLVEEPNFTGTKVDVSVSSNQLRINSSELIDAQPDWDAIADFDNEGGILPEGTYYFDGTVNLGALTNIRIRRSVGVFLEDINDDFDLRQGNIDTWDSFDGPDGNEVNVEVQARISKDDPSGTPTWSDWFKVDSTEESAWGVEARAILTTTDPNYNPRVSKLQLILDEVA